MNLEMIDAVGGDIDLADRFARLRGPAAVKAERTPQSPRWALFQKAHSPQQAPASVYIWLFVVSPCMGLLAVVAPPAPPPPSPDR